MLETGLLAMTSFTILASVASFVGALIGTLLKNIMIEKIVYWQKSEVQ
jgi:hypothetical protein